jgi:hypothetical protein
MAALHLGAEGYSTDGVNGKVGIGTGSPSEALTVYDTSQLSIGSGKGNAGANEIQIKAPNAVLLGLDSKTNGNEFLRFATDARRMWIQSFEATAGSPQSAALALSAGITRGIEIDNAGKVGINCSDPACKLDVNDVKIRVRNPMTPSGTGDSTGNIGDMCWDATCFYVKTGNGWKRAALNTF